MPRTPPGLFGEAGASVQVQKETGVPSLANALATSLIRLMTLEVDSLRGAMNPLSKLRFDALAGYSRSPTMPLVAEELGWFEEAEEKVLGLLVRDLPDDDHACYVLGRDAEGPFPRSMDRLLHCNS